MMQALLHQRPAMFAAKTPSVWFPLLAAKTPSVCFPWPVSACEAESIKQTFTHSLQKAWTPHSCHTCSQRQRQLIGVLHEADCFSSTQKLSLPSKLLQEYTTMLV